MFESKKKNLSWGLAAILVVAPFVLAGCKSTGGGASIKVPERYVLASTPIVNGSAPETRVSPDGHLWYGPNFPRDASGNPIAAKTGVPAGIGANTDIYMLAFFDPSGVLHTQESGNGLNWSNDRTHGTFNVDRGSRPAVTFDYDGKHWFAAFRKTNGTIVIQQLDLPGAAPISIAGATTNNSVGFAWANHQFVLAYRATPGIRVLKSQDGTTWPSGPGDPATANGTPITLAGAPYLINNLGTFYMANNKITPASPTLSHGFIDIYSSSDGINWSLEKNLSPSKPMSHGPAVAGPFSELLVADASAGATSTTTWLNAQPTTTIPTRTSREISLAFGPKGQGQERGISFTFSQFKRTWPESDYEDVRLEVEHRSLTGQVLRTMTPWTLQNAYMHEGHFWNEGMAGTPLPKFRVFMQPGETIVVRVTGDDGTVSKTLNFSDVNTSASNTQLTAEGPQGTTSYIVWYHRGVSNP